LLKRSKWKQFDATKTSSESDSHNKSDQASIDAKNKKGKFSANKISNEDDTFAKNSSSSVHVEQGVNGNNSKQLILLLKTIHILKTLQAVFMQQISMKSFYTSKSTHENVRHSEDSSSSVSAKKGKGGSKFDACKSTAENDSHSQSSLAPKKVEVHSMQVKAPIKIINIFKSLQAVPALKK
ncbi:20215_t:CDS:1, partial [Gigaspora rosea]